MVMYMKYEENLLQELQKKECYILSSIHNLCKENNIEYFIIGGTALGAVRHKGFIPWDDDIDIGMTRENYERFLELSPDALGNDFIIADRKYEKNCPFPYAKVRLKRTKFIEYVNYGIKNISTGVYIDVFPFDKIPSDVDLYKKQFKKVQKYAKHYVIKKQKNLGAPPQNFIQIIKTIIRRVAYYTFKIIPDNFILKKLRKEMTKYNKTNSQEYSCLFFPKLYTEYCKQETLYPLRDYEFENLIVKGPNDMDTYLTNHYGDYMKLPPPELRYGHKPFIVDLNN